MSSPPSPTGDGAGLRQHHWNAGETICAACHDDANPANYTPAGEDVPPSYYFTPDASHPNQPTNPCNPAGEENYAGTSIGLDNDGDGVYDMNDPDCQVAPTATATETATSTDTPTPLPTDTPTALPTHTPTQIPTDTPTALPTGTATSLPTDTATRLPSHTATRTPTATITRTHTRTATATATQPPTATGTPTHTPTVTATPTETPLPVVDLDIAAFRVSKRVSLRKGKAVNIKLVVKNSGEFNSATRPATVIGLQNGAEVFSETQDVYDAVGDGRTTFRFGPYTPVATDDITWTATIADDDPDDATATAFTAVTR